MGGNPKSISFSLTFYKKQTMEILFVDNNPEEASSFKKAIGNLSAKVQVSHIVYCKEVTLVAKSFRPDMIFLGLDPARLEKIPILRMIRSLKELGKFPVIVYSTG